MFAVVRERTADSGMQPGLADEFRRLRAKQPGYQGTMEVATEDGRTILVVLWDSAEQAQAACCAGA